MVLNVLASSRATHHSLHLKLRFPVACSIDVHSMTVCVSHRSICVFAQMASLMSSTSTFTGRMNAFRSAAAARPAARQVAVSVHASRVCQLTGKKKNKANSVCFSNKKTRKWQEPNLQEKKVYWEQGQRWVRLRICTKAIKTINLKGLDIMAKEAGIDLWKLPFEDARPERLAYLQQNKGKVPVAENPRAIKNLKKIAASTKKPRYPVYEEGGRIVWIKPGMEELIFGSSAEGEQQEQELKITISQ